jgi:hypothetical protein
MVRGWNPGGGEIIRTCPDRPWGPPSLLYNGYRVFLGGKVRPGRAADHSPPSSAVVMEEWSYTSTHPLGQTRPVTGLLNLYLYSCSSICIIFMFIFVRPSLRIQRIINFSIYLSVHPVVHRRVQWYKFITYTTYCTKLVAPQVSRCKESLIVFVSFG